MRRKSWGRGVIVIGSNGALDNARQGKAGDQRSGAESRAQECPGRAHAHSRRALYPLVHIKLYL